MLDKQNLRSIFSNLANCSPWSIKVLKIKLSKIKGIDYVCGAVCISPQNKIQQIISSISDFYCSDQGIDSYSSVEKYSGDALNTSIYYFDKDNELIRSSFDLLKNSFGKTDQEFSLKESKRVDATLFQSTIELDEVITPIVLISMQNPITRLKNKFSLIRKNEFKAIDEPILTLRKRIDILIIGEDVYLFSLDGGEKLFDLKRSYKEICKNRVKELVEYKLFSDNEAFSNFANSGINPRRFISFNGQHLDYILDKKNRDKIFNKFNIETDDGLINTTSEENVEKLIKYLCGKAMLDPCDETPVEVAASKPWK